MPSRRSPISWPASTTTSGFTQTFGDTSCHRPIRTSGSTCRTSGARLDGMTVNAGLATTCSSSRPSTPTRTTPLRVWPGVVAGRVTPHARPRERRAILTIACRCARWPMRCCPQATRRISRAPAVNVSPVTDPGRRAGISEHSAGGRADDDARELHDDGPRIFRTPIRTRQLEVEQRIRAARAMSVGYRAPARPQSDRADQSERADVRSRRGQQWLPAESGLREQQPVLVGRQFRLRRPHVSFLQRPPRGAAIGCPTRIEVDEQSRRDVLRSPIDPFDLSKDWGRSDGDQRHRLVVTGAVDMP